MKNKIYYIVAIFLIVAVAVVVAIFLTSRGKGSIIDIALPSKGQAFHRSSSIILSPGTTQNLYFHKSGWWIKKIEYRLPDLTNTDYTLKALVTIKGEKPREEDWTSVGKKVFCLNRRTENMKDVVLTIENNSASTTLKEDIQVFAMNGGCDEWSGFFKYEWEDEKTNGNEKGVLQATFTLKENAYATEYIPSDGGYNYNILGCMKDAKTITSTMNSDGGLSDNGIRLVPLDDGSFELKLPAVWGVTQKAKEYIKKNRTCIYGKEPGDVVNDLGEQTVRTLKEVMAEKIIITPDTLTGNMVGEKTIEVQLEDGGTRKIKMQWDIVRQ